MKTKTKNLRLRLWFILAVAIILLSAVVIIIVVGSLMRSSQIVPEEQFVKPSLWWIIMLALTSIIIGMAVTFIFNKLYFKPMDKVIENMKKLAEGDFSVRLIPSKQEKIKDIANTFNALASELESIEILRSDFVNNFSHEIKTPIAAVNGLIELLNTDNLPREKQKQYLSIIEKEITQLSSMTTNILNLSKIEKQEILSDKTRFNISEQIRNCILLQEKGWAGKNLNLSLDFEEYMIYANEELLRQVWINLIDNAIKYSDQNGELKISITKYGSMTNICIENNGEPIDESDYDKIFNKFYQGKSKREKEGNGIGLSIVKKIIDLHGGLISVKSQNGTTAFTISLP